MAITIGIGLTAIPAGIAWFFAYSADWSLASIVLASSLTLIPLVAIILATAVMNTYFTTFWTITYDKLLPAMNPRMNAFAPIRQLSTVTAPASSDRQIILLDF